LLSVLALGIDGATIQVAWAGDIRLAQAGGGFTPDVTGAPADSAGLATRQIRNGAASQRVALVIGNSNYTKLPVLPNPSNDARLMEQTLRKVGFEVVSAIDADRRTIARAVRKFGRALRAGDRDTVGLFYFAGHGVQARGVNYFIPLGADIEDEADLDIEAVSAADILSQMETAGNALNLVILDACRNNPFKGKMRSASRGLARVEVASGSLVAFAAAPGQVAADGEGANSPYTKALVKAMQVPGLSVERMFKQVRISVEAQTGKRQTPWEESSLRGEFYFMPVKAEPAGNAPVAAQQPATQKIDPTAMELSFWNSIKSADKSEYFEIYLSRYPNGIFAEIAKLRIAEFNRKAEADTESTVANNRSPTPATDEAANGKPGKVELAALPPPDASPTPDQQPTVAEETLKRELILAVQRELNRLGCNAGAADGQWGPKGRAAMGRFNKYAKQNLHAAQPTLEAVDALKSKAVRICPAELPNTEPARAAPIDSRSRFDGNWLFDKRGRCSGVQKFTLLIEGGKLYANQGKLNADGSFKFKGTSGRKQWFNGKLRGNTGSGSYASGGCRVTIRKLG
jgi:hypothetical protein